MCGGFKKGGSPPASPLLTIVSEGVYQAKPSFWEMLGPLYRNMFIGIIQGFSSVIPYEQAGSSRSRILLPLA